MSLISLKVIRPGKVIFSFVNMHSDRESNFSHTLQLGSLEGLETGQEIEPAKRMITSLCYSYILVIIEEYLSIQSDCEQTFALCHSMVLKIG